jgi:hypothetical protein
MIWPKYDISINGEKHSGIAPLIISASRSTDIPAFFAEDIIDQLKKGYTFWTNPFNGKKTLISFSKTKFIVFWTKNADPIIPFLEQIDKMGIHYYFNYTLNDYEIEGLEKNLPVLEKRIETFKNLSDKIGKEKTIWRFDPLILLKGQNDEILIDKITSIAEEIHKNTSKLVISFVDTSYTRVTNNIKKSGLEFQDFNKDRKIDFLKKLSQSIKLFGLEIYTCAEKEELYLENVNKNRCIDHELIEKIAPNETELVNFIKALKMQNKLKDKGQRKHCGCMVSKDIGNYNTCHYSCTYCYAGNAKM